MKVTVILSTQDRISAVLVMMMVYRGTMPAKGLQMSDKQHALQNILKTTKFVLIMKSAQYI